jgi:hypothetical protein
MEFIFGVGGVILFVIVAGLLSMRAEEKKKHHAHV